MAPNMKKRSSMLLLVAGLAGLLCGCAGSNSDKADYHMISGDVLRHKGWRADSLDSYRTAHEFARKAKEDAQNDGGEFDLTPFEQVVARGKAESGAEAARLLNKARDLARTDPWEALSLLERAQREAGEHYGNVPEVSAQAAALAASPEMEAARVIRPQMDRVTGAIDTFLAARSSYDSEHWAEYWSSDAHATMLQEVSRLDSLLERYAGLHPGPVQQRRDTLSRMRVAMQGWEEMAKQTHEATEPQGQLLARFLLRHEALRRYVGGTSAINHGRLRASWGVQYSHGWYNWKANVPGGFKGPWTPDPDRVIGMAESADSKDPFAGLNRR